jgi:hypothetical protein
LRLQRLGSLSLIGVTRCFSKLGRSTAHKDAEAPVRAAVVRDLRPRRRVAVLATAVALAVSAVGCSSGPLVNTGPFGGADWNSGFICDPLSHPGEIVTDGFIEVTDNWRGTVAVIDKISLVRPHGLKLLRAYAVRVGNDAAYGDMPGPPSVHVAGFTYPEWRHHVNAIGARVPYVRHLAFQTNLLLELKTSARKSTDQGINVWYHAGTQHYHLRTHFALEWLARPAHC